MPMSKVGLLVRTLQWIDAHLLQLGSSYADILYRALSTTWTESREAGADAGMSQQDFSQFTDAEIIDYERFL